jgi:hypothetical protein
VDTVCEEAEFLWDVEVERRRVVCLRFGFVSLKDGAWTVAFEDVVEE